MTETSPPRDHDCAGRQFRTLRHTAANHSPHTGSAHLRPHDRQKVADIGSRANCKSVAISSCSANYKMPERTAETIVDGVMAAQRRPSPPSTPTVICGSPAGSRHDHPRRRKHLSGGSRKPAPAAPEDCPGPARRRSRSRHGRGMLRLHRAKAGEKLEAQELAQWCRAHMARHKLPKYIELLSSFPLTPSGKIKKYELRELALQRLGRLPEPAAQGVGPALCMCDPGGLSRPRQTSPGDRSCR